MALINEIEIHVINEHLTYANQVSEHPIENEANITDHVKKQPIGFELTGIVVDGLGEKTAAQIKQSIQGFMDKAEIVKYSGRNDVSMCLITNFATDHDAEIANGFRFTMSLRILQRAKISVAEVPVYANDLAETEALRDGGIVSVDKPMTGSSLVKDNNSIRIEINEIIQVLYNGKRYKVTYRYDSLKGRKTIGIQEQNETSEVKETREFTGVILEVGEVIEHIPLKLKRVARDPNNTEKDAKVDTKYGAPGAGVVYLAVVE